MVIPGWRASVADRLARSIIKLCSSPLFRKDELVAGGEQQPVLLPAMLDYQLPAAGKQVTARDGQLALVGFFRPLFRIRGNHDCCQMSYERVAFSTAGPVIATENRS